MKYIFGFGLAVLMLCYTALSWGYVAHTFYHWFILPSFPTFRDFSITQFIGFIVFLNCILPHSKTHLKDEFKDKEWEIISFIFSPWLSLLFGWIIYGIFF